MTAATTRARQALLSQCVEHLTTLSKTMSQADCAHWLGLELTMGQVKATLAVSVRGPLSVGELARALGLSEPSASLLVDKLEEQGLVGREQDETDRRRTLVVLTGEGAALADRLRSLHNDRWTEWLAALTDEELADVGRGLAALARVAREGQAAPPDEPVLAAQPTPVAGSVR